MSSKIMEARGNINMVLLRMPGAPWTKHVSKNQDLEQIKQIVKLYLTSGIIIEVSMANNSAAVLEKLILTG